MYKLNPALSDFWRSPKRNKVLYGGRASSKSHDAAGFAVFLAANYTVKFLCARQFQNKISESVYVLIKDKIENSEFRSEFILTKNSIKHKQTGSEFLFYGIARNLNEIKSTEGVDVLWLEEAHYLTQEQWEVIEPTIRKEGSQIWIIFNPDEYMDFVYQHFIVNADPNDTEVRQINYDQNPFLSDTMIKVIEAAYKADKRAARYIYEGIPKMGEDKSVIPLTYILAAIDAHKKIERWGEVTGSKRIGYDVADDGKDKNATTTFHGNVAKMCTEWEGLEDRLTESVAQVYEMAVMEGASVTFDSIGVGAHVGSKMRELNEARGLNIEYDGFNAGSKVDNPDEVFMELPHIKILNKDHFANIKAQKWMEVSTAFRKTYEVIEYGANHPIDELISIDSETMPKAMLEKLKMELSAPKKDHDNNGRFKVESKDDLRDRGVKSPNIADSFIMGKIVPRRDPIGFFSL
ncbi:terminase large subunit [Luteibacter phage vB_LflM-Pluto]|uniref:Terminase large subunit n=1 Tax=Luteibacter phage vB_LflM-Pluto TaxID=2948611 RepID=A0A9E7MV84_9CAUD|nr:terminase large subunit [Luteibacter phage vB_LflM-Pluto]